MQIKLTDTISTYLREDWNALFPGELENFDYLQAIETAGLEGFRWRYVSAHDDGKLIAAAPGFFTEYALDTTLTGVGRQIVSGLRKLAPGALVLRLGCLGSPCTETALAGFAPDLDANARGRALSAMLRSFDADARQHACGLLAVKDVPAAQKPLWQTALRPAGYRPVPGLPVASLVIRWKSIEEYLAALSSGARKDMRRKLRARAQIRVERRRNIDDVMDRVLTLYADTHARADMQFEELTAAYFRDVLATAPGAACTLYFAGPDLLAANLTLEDSETLLDKFFFMNAAAGRAYNLYFLSWFENVAYCILHGLKCYQSGQAGYANKLRLGSELSQTEMYFRHRNPLISAALQTAAPLFTGPLAPEP
jgi:predicted N-acyltransferase